MEKHKSQKHVVLSMYHDMDFTCVHTQTCRRIFLHTHIYIDIHVYTCIHIYITHRERHTHTERDRQTDMHTHKDIYSVTVFNLLLVLDI